MTQLILDTNGSNIVLPESQNGKYSVELTPMSVEVEMISGRLVKELRGSVWNITYQYGYFNDEMKNAILAVCKKGIRQSIQCAFLQPDSDGALTYSDFFISFSYPKFMWGRNGQPLWLDFNLSLREVRPHD